MAFNIANALQPQSFNPAGVMEAANQNALAQSANTRADAEASRQAQAFQNALADRQAAQGQVDAKSLVTTAQYVVQAKQPKQLLMNLAQTNPKVAEFLNAVTQHHGVDWSTVGDDGARNFAQSLVAQFGPQAGIGPVAPKIEKGGPGDTFFSVDSSQGTPQVSPVYSVPPKPEAPGTMYQYIGPDGKPTYGSATDVQGKTPYNKPAAGDSYSPNSVETTAQMIASGQIPMLTGFSLKTPWGQAVVARVGQIAPAIPGQPGSGYQGTTYPTHLAAVKDFTSGKSSDAVRYLNVAISHLGTLGDLSTALQNGDIQLINRAAIAYKTQTGQAAPTNFAGARSIVANEIVKAVTASGGGVTDRQEAQAEVSAANSPEQLAGVIQTWKQLLSGQLGGLKQKYEQGTGNKDFNRFLSPQVVSQLEGGQGDSGQQPEVTATGPNGQKLALRNGQWVPK